MVAPNFWHSCIDAITFTNYLTFYCVLAINSICCCSKIRNCYSKEMLLSSFLSILSFLHLARSSCISSLAGLQDALDSSESGDTILICDGDYEEWQIEIMTHGVHVRAETPGQVSLHRSSWVTLGSRDNMFSGVVFHGGGSSTSPMGGEEMMFVVITSAVFVAIIVVLLELAFALAMQRATTI